MELENTQLILLEDYLVLLLGLGDPGLRLTGKQTTSRPDTLLPKIWKDMSDASKRKEKKQKWAIEKPKRDNWKIAWCLLHWPSWWRIQGSHEKCARESWKFRCQLRCLANFNVTSTGKPVAQLKEHKTKYGCFVEADESLRKHMEGFPHENHEDHIAGTIIWVHIFLCLKQWKDQMQRQQ